MTKVADPRRMRVEIEKCVRARALAEASGLFKVPEVLEYDPSSGRAVFERIHGIQPVRRLVAKSDGCRSLMERVARVLAVVHQGLTLPEDMKCPLPPELDLSGQRVFLHGDFNGLNVCVASDSQSIVVLDWQMTSRHGGQATYGTCYFDLVWFVNYLLWTPTPRDLFSSSVLEASQTFVKAYFETSNLSGDREEYTEYMRRFFELKRPLRRQQASRRARFLLRRSDSLTGQFLMALADFDPVERSLGSAKNRGMVDAP